MQGAQEATIAGCPTGGGVSNTAHGDARPIDKEGPGNQLQVRESNICVCVMVETPSEPPMRRRRPGEIFGHPNKPRTQRRSKQIK